MPARSPIHLFVCLYVGGCQDLTHEFKRSLHSEDIIKHTIAFLNARYRLPTREHCAHARALVHMRWPLLGTYPRAAACCACGCGVLAHVARYAVSPAASLTPVAPLSLWLGLAAVARCTWALMTTAWCAGYACRASAETSFACWSVAHSRHGSRGLAAVSVASPTRPYAAHPAYVFARPCAACGLPSARRWIACCATMLCHPCRPSSWRWRLSQSWMEVGCCLWSRHCHAWFAQPALTARRARRRSLRARRVACAWCACVLPCVLA